MTETEIRTPKYGADRRPAPLTVGELRERLAQLPDDATLRYNDYRTAEYSDWYTDVIHVVAVSDDGVLELGSNADYIVREPEPDWDDEDEDEDGSAAAGAPAAAAADPDEVFLDTLIDLAHEQHTLAAYDEAMIAQALEGAQQLNAGTRA